MGVFSCLWGLLSVSPGRCRLGLQVLALSLWLVFHVKNELVLKTVGKNLTVEISSESASLLIPGTTES